MITGAHFLLYSSDPDADRAFLHDVLKFRSVDVGHGWLIFALPPAEIAVHPSEKNFVQSEGKHKMAGTVFYLMCDDVKAEVKALKARGVICADIEEEQWGSKTSMRLPSGMELGLYQPKHKTAI